MKSSKVSSKVKGISLLFVVCALLMLSAMGIVRGKCVATGYELSRMANTLEALRIDMEKIESDRSVVASKEQLFNMANSRGFIFKEEGKAFNVK
jgi:TPP-dependent indolepyruvate ferredoxin oxidoreductase alpha subunit